MVLGSNYVYSVVSQVLNEGDGAIGLADHDGGLRDNSLHLVQGLGAIYPMTRCQLHPQRVTQGINKGVNLCGCRAVINPTRHRPRTLTEAIFFLLIGLLVRPHRGRVDHCPIQLRVLQGLKADAYRMACQYPDFAQRRKRW